MSRKQGHYLVIVIQLAFLFAFSNSIAQINQPHRFELEQKGNDYNFTIVSAQSEGLFLVREAGKIEDGKKVWDIVHLDSTLKKVWSDEIKLASRLDLIGYEYSQNQIFLLFRSGDTNTGTNSDFTLLHFKLPTHEYTEHEIKHQFEFRITHFTVAGSTAILGGYAVREPAVLLFSIKEKQLKVVPGFLLHDTDLLDIRINHNNTFNVLMAERKTRDGKKLLVRTYDESGTLLLDDVIPMEKDKTPLSGITSALVRDEMIVIGTYGVGVNSQASGFFSVMVDPYADQPVRYTDLTQFEHFLDYMGEKKADKIKQKAERQRKLGKPATFKNSVSLIRIHETTKGFLLLAEAYYSSTSLNSAPYWNNYPNNYGYARPMYAGYGYNPYGSYPYSNRYNSSYPYSNNSPHRSDVRMIESVTVLFDEKAKPDWDESLKFNNLKYSGIEQASDFTETDKGVFIVYKNNSELISKLSIPHDDHFLQDTTKIKLLHESDEVRNDSDRDGALRHWYNNNFYTWGYHSVKDTSKQSEDPTRHVFFINKISTE